MAIRTYDILLDSYNSTMPEPIVGRQGDKNGAVTLHVTITDRGTAVDLTGQTINLMAETAKGTAVVADNGGVTLTDAKNGRFDYAIPNALWSEAGKITKAYFSLNDSNGQQTTYDLIFIVKKAIDISQDKADDYITIIDGTLRDLKTKVDAVNEAYENGAFYSKSESDEILGLLSDFKMVGTTVADKINGEFEDRGVNVNWFGAVGDGTTDDTAVLQDTFNNYDKIFMPAGNYVITNTLIIKKSNLTIYGQGVTIIVDADNTVAINMKGDNLNINDLNFRLADGRTSGTEFCLGIADESSNVTLDNINISGFTNCVIDVYNSKNLVFNNCEFSNAMTTATAESPKITNGYGIVLQCSKDVKINNCTFNKIYRHAVYISCHPYHNLDHCDNIIVKNCQINRDIDSYITNFEHPIKNMSGTNIIVEDNYFKNCGSGFMEALYEKAGDDAKMQPQNVFFRNNVFENLLAGQINHNGMVEELNGCSTDGFFITDNTVTNGDMSAVIKLSRAAKTVIDNNNIYNSTLINFIAIEYGSSKISISNNSLYEAVPGAFINFLGYDDSALYDELIINNNHGYMDSVIYTKIANETGSINIRNNDFYSNNGITTAIYLSKPTDLTTYISNNLIKGFRYAFGFPNATTTTLTRIFENDNVITDCKMGTIEEMGANIFMIKPFRNPYKKWQNYVYSRSDNTMPDPAQLNYGDIYLPSTSNADGIASIVVDKNGSKAFAKISAIL